MFGWSGGPAGIFFAGPKGYQENGDSHGDPYFEGMSLRTLACYCLLVMFSWSGGPAGMFFAGPGVTGRMGILIVFRILKGYHCRPLLVVAC